MRASALFTGLLITGSLLVAPVYSALAGRDRDVRESRTIETYPEQASSPANAHIRCSARSAAIVSARGSGWRASQSATGAYAGTMAPGGLSMARPACSKTMKPGACSLARST